MTFMAEVRQEDERPVTEKRDKVFELTLDLAINHLKWAA